MSEDKSKALSAALSQIEKQFGKGAVMRLGEKPMEDVDVISTGSLGLDVALGIGGLPRGRVVEIYGPESSGKTTLTLQTIAQCQKSGFTAAFIDAEHALDMIYAEKLGVDVKKLLVSQPDTGEQALEITDMLVRSGGVDVVVIANILFQTEDKERVIEEAWRVLRAGGRAIIIDWQDSFNNIGPHKDHVITREKALALATRGGGFKHLEDIPAGSFHYGLILKKN